VQVLTRKDPLKTVPAEKERASGPQYKEHVHICTRGIARVPPRNQRSEQAFQKLSHHRVSLTVAERSRFLNAKQIGIISIASHLSPIQSAGRSSA